MKAPAFALLLLVGPSALWSQVDSSASARISGRIVSAYNGRALSGVTISASGMERFAITDSSGAFLLSELPAGPFLLHMGYAERESGDYSFTLRAGKTTNLLILLEVDAEDLAPIVVEGQNLIRLRNLAGFFERQRRYTGFARFFSREDIGAERANDISYLLLHEGIVRRCVPECIATRFSRGRLCAVPVNMNGLPVWSYDFDRVPIAEVTGVEIYRPSMQFGPTEFSRNIFVRDDWLGQRASCGSVQIWTR